LLLLPSRLHRLPAVLEEIEGAGGVIQQTIIFPSHPSSSDLNKRFARNCCSEENGNPVPRAEGSGGVLTSMKEDDDLFSDRSRSTFRNGTFVGWVGGVSRIPEGMGC